MADEDNVIYLGRSNTYNLAYANALSEAGFNVINKTELKDDFLSHLNTADILIIDSYLASAEKIELLLGELQMRGHITMVIVPDEDDESNASGLSVRFLKAGAGDTVNVSGDTEVFLARLTVLLRQAGRDISGIKSKSSRSSEFVLDVGDVLDHYRLDVVLGIGGMGVVYKATDLNLDRSVAIKILPSGVNLKEKLVKRFLREGEIMAHLNVPEAVKIYDVGSSPVNYIVMELLSGVDLETILQERLFTPKEAVQVISGLAKALYKIHEAGVIHRDLKPSNILLDSRGRWRILDFGISKLMDAELTLTRPGSVMGTPDYMAPEQIDDKVGPIDARTDIYALGIMMYEMITGNVPFKETGFINVLKEIVFGNPISLRKELPDIDVNLDNILRRATARKQKDRYQSMHELALALDGLNTGLPSYGIAKRS
ncbi:serine/threonine protein kinase [bacterium]|nr:serine/threonine protein kinase [bacterium]